MYNSVFRYGLVTSHPDTQHVLWYTAIRQASCSGCLMEVQGGQGRPGYLTKYHAILAQCVEFID